MPTRARRRRGWVSASFNCGSATRGRRPRRFAAPWSSAPRTGRLGFASAKRITTWATSPLRSRNGSARPATRPDDAALRERIVRVRRETEIQSAYRAKESQHFAVVYEGRRQEDVGQEFVRLLEQAYLDVGYVLGAYPSAAVPVIFYSDVDFAPATGFSTDIGGYYNRLDGKIRVALRGLQPGDSRLASLVMHEYTHALIYAVSRGNNPPRWVHEGLAIHMEQRRAPQYKEEARRRARASQLESLQSSPYVMGSVATEHLVDRYGMATIRLLLQRLGEGKPFPQAFQETFRTDLATFEQTVRDVVTRGYWEAGPRSSVGRARPW